MTDRQRLPDRRLTRTEMLRHDGVEFSLGVGFNATGAAKEIFMNGAKVGSNIEAIIQDGCVLASMLLQRGATVERLAQAVAREDAHALAPHASILGAALRHAADMEAELGGQVHQGYAAAAEQARRRSTHQQRS